MAFGLRELIRLLCRSGVLLNLLVESPFTLAFIIGFNARVYIWI
jgi:hypothetical protein